MSEDKGGQVAKANRYFTEDGEFFHENGKTYILSNQWGSDTLSTVDKLAELFPHLGINLKKMDS